MSDLRIGDVVAVTARVKGIRGDGGVWLEPLGFDWSVDWDGRDDLDADDGVELNLYTVDEPKLVRRGLVRGDERFAADGERYLYHEDLGNGLHLLNRPGAKQHLTGAWLVLTTGEVGTLQEVPPG